MANQTPFGPCEVLKNLITFRTLITTFSLANSAPTRGDDPDITSSFVLHVDKLEW